MKVFIKGLNSCAMRRGKLGQYRQYLIANGHEVVVDPASADHVLVWTCAFRGDIRDNSIAELQRYEREFVNATVIAAGCLPDIDRPLLDVSFAGTVVPWKSEAEVLEPLFGANPPLATFSPLHAEEKVCDDAAAYRKAHPGADVQFHDQFVKLVVSEGCTYKCAYCSERLMFPAPRSFPLSELLSRAACMMSEQGAYDIVLLADSLGEYGKDIGTDLLTLINALCSINKRVRVALNNINPSDIVRFFDGLFVLVALGKIAHMNIPIQSASDAVLKRMNRTYTKAELERIFSRCTELGFTAFDTHLIVGFPGETDADVDETITFLLKHRVRYVLMSRFMRAPGMDVSHDPALTEQVLARRMAYAEERLRAAGVICNSEDGDVMKNRFERLNKEG